MEFVVQLPQDINKLCRTCMDITKPPEQTFEHYIVKNNHVTELGEILENITQRKVTADDSLPKTICSKCMHNLKIAHTYKLRCKRIEEQLLNILLDCKHESDKDIYVQVDPITCCDCGWKFSTSYQLYMHNIEHHKSNATVTEQFLKNRDLPKEDLITAIDLNVYDLIKERKSHIEKDNTNLQKTQDTKYQCKVCFAKFISRKHLYSHLCKCDNSNLENGKLLNCTLCDKEFSDLCSLSLHFLKHTFGLEKLTVVLDVDEEFIFCEICGELFEASLSLQEHYSEKHDGNLTWRCSVCLEEFKNEAHLLKHSKIHLSPDLIDATGPFPCVLCRDTFPDKNDLLKHAVMHLKKKYSCKKCSSSFCTQPSYHAHVKSHFNSGFACKTCDKILSSKSALKGHIIGVHSIESLHKCEVCGKGFTTQNRLHIHLQIHSTSKKYQCSSCGYKTHKVGDLRIHMRIHTSERPYKCTFSNCSMSFKTSSHLCDHVRRHLNIRKYKCIVCSHTFSSNHGLKIHHMQHTGERPFTCQVCQQTFRRKHHLKIHMKQHACTEK